MYLCLSKLAGTDDWAITSNPRWDFATRAGAGILLNEFNAYMQYRNCGIEHRMIRFKQAQDYGLGEIKPEWILMPEKETET